MKKIGMIGLGAMGHSVAENVLKAGFPMVLFDILLWFLFGIPIISHPTPKTVAPL